MHVIFTTVHILLHILFVCLDDCITRFTEFQGIIVSWFLCHFTKVKTVRFSLKCNPCQMSPISLHTCQFVLGGCMYRSQSQNHKNGLLKDTNLSSKLTGYKHPPWNLMLKGS